MLNSSMLARCPTCRNTFSTDHPGRQNCPVCGKPLVVPEPAAPTAEVLSGGPGEPPPPAGTPWERRAELGFVNGWMQTVQQALFEPARLFASARLDRASAQVGFAVLTASVFGGIGQVLGLLFRGQSQAFVDRLLAQQEMPDGIRQMLHSTQRMSTPGMTLLGLLLFPLVNFVLAYLNAGVTHGFALLLGQSRRGFSATFAACAYAWAPLVLLAVPGCGAPVAIVWLIVLTGIGLKECHGIKPAGAASAVLAPYVLLCCLGCLGGGVLVSTLRNMMQGMPQ